MVQSNLANGLTISMPPSLTKPLESSPAHHAPPSCKKPWKYFPVIYFVKGPRSAPSDNWGDDFHKSLLIRPRAYSNTCKVQKRAAQPN